MCYQLPGSITRDSRPSAAGSTLTRPMAPSAGALPKSGAIVGASPNGPDLEHDVRSVGAAPHVGDWDPHEDVEPDEAAFH